MDFLQQNLVWVVMALVSGTMLVWPMFAGTGIDSLSTSAATLKMNREDAMVLDVRETHEWSAGHIPGSRHISLAQLEKRLSELEKYKSRAIIVCCASGNRSSSACNTLKKAGFEKVFNLSGGMGSWAEANLPITKKT